MCSFALLPMLFVIYHPSLSVMLLWKSSLHFLIRQPVFHPRSWLPLPLFLWNVLPAEMMPSDQSRGHLDHYPLAATNTLDDSLLHQPHSSHLPLPCKPLFLILLNVVCLPPQVVLLVYVCFLRLHFKSLPVYTCFLSKLIFTQSFNYSPTGKSQMYSLWRALAWALCQYF